MSNAMTYTEDDTDKIAELLVGHRIVQAEMGSFDYPGRDSWDRKPEGRLTLDDGTVLYVAGHEGGCSCGAGDYDLKVLNGVDNVITNVEFDFHPDTDEGPWGEPNEAKRCNPDQDEYTGHYRIFVYAEDRKINLMQFDGSDGNGYYGTGFSLTVVRP